MATLTTIPLEVLLLILRKLDTVDVVRLGMTCRDLHRSTDRRHVWIDQTQNHRQRSVALKFSIPSPTALPTEALKRFAILQAKLRIRWDRLPDGDNWERLRFVASGTMLLPGQLDLILLPGGELVISIDKNDNSISLHRIKLFGGHLSLVKLTDLSRGERGRGGVFWNKTLPAMAPNPVFSYACTNSVYLFGISPDGETNLEREFLIPNSWKLLSVNGQGRIAGFFFLTESESLVVTIIHLDYPGVTLEIQLPSDCEEPVKDLFTLDTASRVRFENMRFCPSVERSWKVCFPTPELVVICGHDSVLAYPLPPFSTLPDGKHSLQEHPTWRLSSVMEFDTRRSLPRTCAEVFYDPSLPDCHYNIHFSCCYYLDHFDSRQSVEITTLNIDPSNPSSSSSGTPTYQRVERRFSIDGRLAPRALHPDIYHSRTKVDSEGLTVWVTSLEDISSAQACEEGQGKGSLCMFVSNDELEPDLEWENVDLDEASGRVFIWGPTYRWMTPCETRVFVGELVS